MEDHVKKCSSISHKKENESVKKSVVDFHNPIASYQRLLFYPALGGLEVHLWCNLSQMYINILGH